MRKIKQTKFAMIVGLLGAALLMGSPLTSEADPGGKWWAGGGKGKGQGRGRGQVERRQESRGGSQQSDGRQWSGGGSQRSDRQQWSRGGPQQSGGRQWSGGGSRQSDRRQWSGGGSYSRDYSGSVTRYRGAPTYGTSYRAPVWGGSRQFTGQRFYRSYGSVPVYRDYVAVSVRSHYRPVYGWRYYCPPAYYYPTHVVYVRPVRFFVAANFSIGGLGISAAYADPGPVYGCNFCDARFSDYGDYENHVEHCPYAPAGYRVMAEEWDQNYSDEWRDDQVGDRRYEEYQQDDDNEEDLDR
jgi:hypothetical protein